MANTPDFEALRAPFPSATIGWRVGATTQAKDKGQALPYIDARDVQNRLDEVVGPAGWQVHFTAAPAGTGVLCTIALKVGDVWVEKQDVGRQEKEDDGVRAERAAAHEMASKGAASDAFKRAAVMWGIGRYLYGYDAPWVALRNKNLAEIPVLPDHMLPENERSSSPRQPAQSQTAKTMAEGHSSSVTASGKASADNAAPAAVVAPRENRPATTPVPTKPMYDSSVAGDAEDPSAEGDGATTFQSSVAGEVEDPTAATLAGTTRAEPVVVVGTPEQWATLSGADQETVRFLHQRILMKKALRNVLSFLTEGNGTKLPPWARESLLKQIGPEAQSEH